MAQPLPASWHASLIANAVGSDPFLGAVRGGKGDGTAARPRETIFAGTSTGANIVAALSVAERLGADPTVATLIVDSGLRYLSTDVFR